MEGQPLSIGGKSYISSRRAAEMFGYTNDYIGQLSRSKKINSIMVGRDRFIDLDSITAYVESKSSLPQAYVPKVDIPKAEAAPMAVSNAPRLNTQALRFGVGAATGLLVFSFFLFSGIGQASVAELTGGHFTYLATRSAQVSGGEIYQSASVISGALDLGKKADTVYIGFLKKIQDKIVSFFGGIRTRVLAYLKPYLGGGTQTQTTVVEQPKTVVTTSTTTVVRTGLSEADVRAISEQVAADTIAKTIDYTSQKSGSNVGLVVRPSTGNATTDAALKQTIQNSFSDQVNVTLDNSRAGGVIKPIFRDPTDDSYLFVVVPINQK